MTFTKPVKMPKWRQSTKRVASNFTEMKLERQDGTVRLYSRGKEAPLYEWPIGQHPQLAVSFYNDTVLMGDGNGNVLMSRVTNGRLVGTLPAVR